ncbi:hypothetical protein Cme02nite_73580 [Catellatospora methionotrophica]|uniref:Uncharacterized protein n=1 Tax=Catellatospora methionotrophica TaxID=121620 RepID=A0A8J3LPF0_9ACTN|nr:hypothetical protein [Catellatospora methionotrophica]GIG19026.1 hypothetical protein Cme02nite_73580 [Catellatospora methionotrophica]
MRTAPEHPDTTETARRARFGTLPQQIRPEEMVEERPASTPADHTYNSDDWLVRYCW